jgi:hypothetical protein
VPFIIGHLCVTGSHEKKKSTKVVGVGGQIVVPRPLASALLTGRRQKLLPEERKFLSRQRKISEQYKN